MTEVPPQLLAAGFALSLATWVVRLVEGARI